MAEEGILSLPSNSHALRLLTSIHKNPLISLQQTTEPVPKLSLKNGHTITGETTISEFLSQTQDKITWTPESRAEIYEWLIRSSKFVVSPEDVYEFDGWMASRCFALRGPKPTWVDFFLYARLHPVVKGWSKEESWRFPAIFRFVDYIQHREEIGKLTVHERGELGPIALSDVREIPPEYKLARNERPTNALPMVARSGASVAAVTKSLAATSLNPSDPAATTTTPSTDPAAAKKDKKAEKLAKKADKKADKKASSGESKPAKEKKPEESPNPGMIDLRVGLILKAEKHPDADSLYVSHIDVGEEKERVVCSGLVKYIPLEEMQNRKVVCVCNLKEVKMRGIMSQAMVLAASEPVEGDAEKEKVELVIPPEGAKPGAKVYVEGFGEAQPENVLPPKKKIFESVQPGFTTLDNLTVAWKKPETEGAEHKGLVTKVDGVEVLCKVKSIVGATVR